MHKALKLSSTLLCLTTFVMIGCAETDEPAEETAEPAAMPAPEAMTPAGEMPAAPTVTQLDAKNNSGITGEVSAAHTPSDVTVQISLNGLTSGVTYPAHIHTGTCESGGPVAVELTSIEASGVAGQSSSTVEASKLTEGQAYFVQVHGADGQPVACSNLPGHTTMQ